VLTFNEAYRAAIKPEPPLKVSEWADKHRMLPATASEPGRWRTSRTPYLREIMDCLSSSTAIERVILMKGAQIGATEAGLNWIGYLVAHAPGIMLCIMPSVDTARRNARMRIDPMIAATPALRDKIAPPRSRDSENTALSKSFPGGQLIFTGANSAGSLSSTPVRYLFLDEVDRYPADVEGEGDPVALAIVRTSSFPGRRKIYLCSTPTIAGVSRIEAAYGESDQRRFFLPCPHCGEFQEMVWANVRWPEGQPEQAHYVCHHNGCVIEEHQKPGMMSAGEWRATADGDGRTAGFHLSSLYSPFETWAGIAVDFLAAKIDPARLQAWVNLKLGEPFEDRETAPLAADTLERRAEHWNGVPPGVLVVTVGVDVQGDRLEIEFVGWGRSDENWSLDYVVLHGDPAKNEVWAALDAQLMRRFGTLPVAATAIDTGGHHTDVVMKYCSERINRRVWPIKGRGGPGVTPWPKRPPKPKQGLAPLYIVGVDGLKQTLMARLRSPVTEGPTVCHFPAGRERFWFEGLVSERAIRKYKAGVARIEWVKDPAVRNEPLDCRVYAMAALHGLHAKGLRLDGETQRPTTAAQALAALNKR
jgi:phage terminase large subunit GpA-like protein